MQFGHVVQEDASELVRELELIDLEDLKQDLGVIHAGLENRE